MGSLKIILFAILMTFGGFLFSQEIQIEQPSTLDDVVNTYLNDIAAKKVQNGYRIQINYSSNQQEINKEKGGVYRNFPNERVYVIYEQPYFKLRVGDYKTRMEAAKALRRIVLTYPSAFIVLDEIKAR